MPVPFNYPQEFAYLSVCKDVEDSALCTLSQLENQVRPILEKYIKKFKKDTIDLALRFRFDPEGHAIDHDIKLKVSKKSLREKLMPELKEATADLSFYVINHNNSKYPSSHNYNYKFVVNKANLSMSRVEDIKGYTGGEWGQIPLFPDCPRMGDQEDRLCFQEHMQAHIKKHFRYPPAALRYGIQGKVDVSFVISSMGEVTKLEMKSPSDILKKEAARIISLLPTFKPGIQNGKAVRVPYSIPIWFRLN